MDNLSDTQIRANLRTLLTESGIDPNRTSFVCSSGTVRLLGSLFGLGESRVRSAQVDDLEQSIRRSRGVKRVHLNVDNWKRGVTGEWKQAEGDPEGRTPRGGSSAADRDG